eukprot:2201668-Rhodomonas_salina.1
MPALLRVRVSKHRGRASAVPTACRSVKFEGVGKSARVVASRLRASTRPKALGHGHHDRQHRQHQHQQAHPN